jgi:RNA polymerase sigma-70 factor (ECF subfamily)
MASPVAFARVGDPTTRPAEHRSVSGSSTDALQRDEERTLVVRAQAGDTAAFRALYQRFSPAVYRYAILPLVHDRTLAEDLLADTFVRALENIGRFEWQGKGVLPWLIRIAKNLCLDHLRKSGRVADWPIELEQLVPDPGEWNGETLAAHRQITGLMRTRIDECLDEINPRYRRVLELRLVQGVARDRAARAMDVSIGTLDVLLFRACKAFRKIYVQRYGEGPQRELGQS